MFKVTPLTIPIEADYSPGVLGDALIRRVGGIVEGKSIVKDTSTGCWGVVCNAVNDMHEAKRAQVTVSGPERFGLTDPTVQLLL